MCHTHDMTDLKSVTATRGPFPHNLEFAIDTGCDVIKILAHEYEAVKKARPGETWCGNITGTGTDFQRHVGFDLPRFARRRNENYIVEPENSCSCHPEIPMRLLNDMLAELEEQAPRYNETSLTWRGTLLAQYHPYDDGPGSYNQAAREYVEYGLETECLNDYIVRAGLPDNPGRATDYLNIMTITMLYDEQRKKTT